MTTDDGFAVDASMSQGCIGLARNPGEVVGDGAGVVECADGADVAVGSDNLTAAVLQTEAVEKHPVRVGDDGVVAGHGRVVAAHQDPGLAIAASCW
jgi:hypothetical protein